MIETVYNSENSVNRTSKVQSTIKMPKNIRQMGKSNSSKKIYIEDYVMTFIKQLAGMDYETCKIAVLVGQKALIETDSCIFISGAIEVKDTELSNEMLLSNDNWTGIYDAMKQYFPESEIVGWYIGGPTYQLEDRNRIEKAHINNFAGKGKALLTYDSMEKEESFYLYENNALVKQDGYYIYFEKNEEMQAYMIDQAKPVSTEVEYVDRVSKEIRNVIQQKKTSVEDQKKNDNRMVYAVGAFLGLIILVVGAALLNNYEQMKNMKKALETLSKNWENNDKDKEELNKIQPSDGVIEQDDSKEEGRLDVDILEGGVTPIEEQATTTTPAPEEKDTSKSEENDEVVKNDSSETKKEVKYYTVQSGDTLAGIAYKLYNSANYISKIKELNNLENEDMIYIGQKLIVP